MLDPGGISAVRHKHKDCECPRKEQGEKHTARARTHRDAEPPATDDGFVA